MIEREELSAHLNELKTATTAFRVYLKHVVPDFILFQYALDVHEQAFAVLTLSTTAVPRASMSNARSANEACLDMLTLVSDPARYDEFGAFARVCELLEAQDLWKRRVAAEIAMGLEPQPQHPSIAEIAMGEGRKWDEGAPGVSRMYQRCLEQALRDGRWKRHWSGAANRTEQVRALEHWLGADSSFALTADALYGVQSVHAHPRPRTGQRIARIDPTGNLEYRTNPLDAAFPCASADLACIGALQALDRRSKLIR